MNIKKLFVLTISCFLIGGIAGCSIKKSDGVNRDDIKTYTSFFAVSNKNRITNNNRLKNVIAEKIGAKCDETWLEDNENAADIVDKMIIANEYPDFLYDAAEHQKLLDAGAYIAIDEYWDDYKNIKNYFSEEEWSKIREDDGHVYIIPVFSNVNMYDTNTMHDDEAFWIQVKVLQWAGYPKITTLDEYFDLIERYIRDNPIGENGSKNIGYEILTDGYLYFCLENPPQFLDGYPNDGACIVDPDTHKVIDYNTTDTAKKWFKKLNDEYKKGIIDPECFVMTKEQYYDKLKTGNVLGMVDQRWNYGPVTADLPEESTYVPLGIVSNEGIKEQYHSEAALNVSEGLGISVSCKDVKGALQFVDDLLSPEIHTLRFWGQKDIDYSVDAEGKFYLTDDQDKNYKDRSYVAENKCDYSYFPYYRGMDKDGINAFAPAYQPYEFYKTLCPIMQECFSAYNVQTYVEMLNKSKQNEPWYPMWSYANTFTDETDYGRAKTAMTNIKHEYLPKVVMSDDFESSWDEYISVYKKESNFQAYYNELQNFVDKSLKK